MLLLWSLLSTGWGMDLFVLDDADSDTEHLRSSLEGEGHSVTLSTDFGWYEYDFDGTLTDLHDYDAILWLEGSGAHAIDMAPDGQIALRDYVEAGGNLLLFGATGFSFRSGYNVELGSVIPLQSFSGYPGRYYRCVVSSHAMAEGCDEESVYLAGTSIQDSSEAFGEMIWEMGWEGWGGPSYTDVGVVAAEVGVGRIVQWALWGNAGSLAGQADWTDGDLIDRLEISLEWLNHGPPTADAGGPYEVDAGESVSLDGSDSAAVGGALLVNWSWDFNGDGAVDATGEEVTFVADEHDGPVDVDVILRVTDDEGLISGDSAIVHVRNVAPEIITLVCPDEVEEGAAASFSVVATDVEVEDILTVSWVWPHADMSTGTSVSTTFPDNPPGDSYDVAVLVQDDDGGATGEGCPVIVLNVAPAIVGIPDTEVTVGDEYVFAPSVDDPGWIDTHTWTGSLPAGATLDASTGRISWTPEEADAGTHTLILTVSDGEDETDLVWDIVVNHRDSDGDGDIDPTDCVDDDPTIYTGAPESCDDIDQDCDGDILEDFIDTDGDEEPDCVDTDDDGDGDPDATDCGPLDPERHHGAPEECDWIDSDCDGDLVEGFADTDEDGDPDCIDLDSDSDGLPDAWEEEYGFDPYDPADASSDADGDGRSNLTEYEDGSDPLEDDSPHAPTLVAPEDGGEVDTGSPDLIVAEAVAPLGQALTYSFTVAEDETLASILGEIDGVEPSGSGLIGWTIPLELDENTWYWWTSHASDAYTHGPSMDIASFFVNTVNEPPGIPNMVSPLDGSTADSLTFVVDEATDPDEDELSYKFVLADGEGVVLDEAFPFPGDGEQAEWASMIEIEDGDAFCWWAWAIDEHVLEGLPTEEACFTIDMGNEAPDSPILVSPEADAWITTLTPTITVTNGEDPDGDETWHRFMVDLDPSFSTSARQASGEILSGEDGTTSWEAEELPEDSWVWIRAQSTDGEADSEWVDGSFFVSAVDDPPSVPVLFGPVDGAAYDEDDVLVVTNPVDPEGTEVTIDFRVLSLRDDVLVEEVEVPVGEEDTSEWGPGALEDGIYQWTARGVDAGGVASEWAETATFRVGASDDEPVVEPEMGGVVDKESAGDGCGCSAESGQPIPLWWALLPLGAVLRRRR